jgi:hypothetical protein
MAKGDIWFVEERKLGRWSPVLYHDSAPAERGPGGSHRVFREAPKLVKEKHRHFDLFDLKELYGKKEEL